MQTVKFRNQQLVHGKKAVLTITLFLFSIIGFTQERGEMNLSDHDDKRYYFGIVLGYNTSHYNTTHHPYFLQRDTIMSVESLNSGRVHLGIMANWQVNRFFDLHRTPLDLVIESLSIVVCMS